MQNTSIDSLKMIANEQTKESFLCVTRTLNGQKNDYFLNPICIYLLIEVNLSFFCQFYICIEKQPKIIILGK